MSCTKSSWWILADCLRRCRFYPIGFLLFLFFASFPGRAAEPVFEVHERSVPGILAPEQLGPSFYTFSPEEYWAEPEESYWLSFSNWVLRQERIQGPRVQWLGAWADRTLSGSSQALPNNGSYLRLGFATESEYSDLAQFEPEARFRLDIPTARRKLRIVIESESEELIPLEERQRDRQLTEPERTTTEATGALRYLTQVGDAINLSTDIGGQLRLPLDAFWRVTAGKDWRLDEDWAGRFQQRIYYYYQEGWGSRTWFGASRYLGDWRFQSSSELEWVHSDKKFLAAQIFSLRKAVDNRSTLIPRVGVLGESKPEWRTTSAFMDLTWRYRLHSDWLFGEVIPALEFPREEGFRDRASVVLRIEMYFAGTIDRR